MKPEERSRWANRQKQMIERDLKKITKICRKLAEDKSFTPMEENWIDLQIQKQKDG